MSYNFTSKPFAPSPSKHFSIIAIKYTSRKTYNRLKPQASCRCS